MALQKPNLRIVFSVGGGTFVEDESGNLVESIQEVEVFARVNRTLSPKYYEMPGIQPTDIMFRGKVVELAEDGNDWIPSRLPPTITLETPGKGFLLLDGEVEHEGSFRFMPTIQTGMDRILERFGERIRGYLNTTSRN